MAYLLTPRPSARLRQLMALRPRTPAQLHRFVRVVLGLDVTRAVLTAGNTPPFAYLCHAYFEGGEAHGVTPRASSGASGGDCVVWANRGGGKTMLGAVATLLDLLFKPGIQVRILGGSLEQSEKMYEHLMALLERPLLRGRDKNSKGGATSGGGGVLAAEPTQRRIVFSNGSRVELLSQSHRSVRGTRVHKLRCDEVEDFDLDVWEAAQLVTRSGVCGGAPVRGSVEALSTMHRPFGLMARLLDRRSEEGNSDLADLSDDGQGLRNRLRVFRWNALDVIERCPPARPCEGCPLWDDCRGVAKQANGFIPIDDLIDQRRRTGHDTWSAEVLCRRPRLSDSVYPNFDIGEHVRAACAAIDTAPDDAVTWIGGMDFGLRSPTVMLWAKVVGHGLEAVVHVVDEYIESGLTLDQQLAAIEKQARSRGWPAVAWVGVDPAGVQRNSQTGLTDIDVLKRHGLRVRALRSHVREGIGRIRCRLDHHRLLIHPRCVRLIESLVTYHFDLNHPFRDEPIKDGPDHACDALRYMVLNLEHGPARVDVVKYA